jgi:putative ABC transport system substrate-binding protein
LHELLPTLSRVGMLIYPTQSAEHDVVTVEQAAPVLNLKIIVERAADEGQFNGAFAHWIDAQAEAIAVDDAVYFDTRRSEIIALAASHNLPAVSNNREFAVAGGLASYGANINDAARQCGVYVGRILKGEKPADLPVLQPTKFDLVINLKTASSLGLTVPSALLARADEVIE